MCSVGVYGSGIPATRPWQCNLGTKIKKKTMLVTKLADSLKHLSYIMTMVTDTTNIAISSGMRDYDSSERD
jgi:hypothetical protein